MKPVRMSLPKTQYLLGLSEHGEIQTSVESRLDRDLAILDLHPCGSVRDGSWELTGSAVGCAEMSIDPSL